MSVSIVSSFLLACGLAFTPVSTNLPVEPTTHVLTIKVHKGGDLIIDGVSVGDTVLQLSNANVATLAEAGEGNSLYTVTQPDGEVFYKGDFTIAVQSVTSGTIKIQLHDGEAMLTKAPVLVE